MALQSGYNINVNALLGSPVHSSLLLHDWWELVDGFLQVPAANASISVATNLNWELAGASAACAFSASGGIALTTNAAGGAEALIWPHVDTDQTLLNALGWDLSAPVLFDVVVVPNAVAASDTYAGFKLTAVLDLTTDANAIFFYSTNSGVWQIASSIAGTDALTETTINRTAGGQTRLTMVGGFLAADGVTEQVRCYINSEFVAQVDSPDTGALKPFVGVEGNAQTLGIHAIRLGRKFTT